MLRPCLLSGLAFLCCVSSLRADYYVNNTAPNASDQNPGTSESPFATINRAAGVAQAGDTVWIAPGTYQPTTAIQPANSGTATAPITYRAQPAGPVIIDGQTSVPSSSGRKGLFWIAGKSWIVVDGLRVINSGFSGIFMENSTNITVQNCSTYFTYASGIIATDSATINVLSNSVQKACMLPTPGTGVNECITMASVNGFEVAYNTVHDRLTDLNDGGEGIDAKNSCANGTIHHNHVYDLIRLGIYVDAYSENLSDVEVYANTVHNCGSGITVAAEQGATANGIRIFNNLVHDCRNGAGIRLAGYVGNGPLQNVDVYQNTVVRCGRLDTNAWENCGLLVEADNPTNSNFNVRNNIFSQNTRQIRTKGQPYLTLDRNLVDGPLQGGVAGSNAILADPVFVNAAASDFRLATNSPAIDAALGAFEWSAPLAETTTTLISSANPAVFGMPVTLTATVTSSTGTVTFLDGTMTLGVVTLDGAGIATLDTTTLGLGTHSITAVYSGSPTSAGSVSPILSQSINPITPPAPVTEYFTASDGWTTGWLKTALTTPTLSSTSPLQPGTGLNLGVTRTGGTGSGSQEGVYRQWSEGYRPTTESSRLRFDYRIDSSTNVFNTASDAYNVTVNSVPGASPGAYSSVYIRAFGAATGAMAAREWCVFNGTPGVLDSYDITKFRPTGLIAQPGVTYTFTIEIHTNATYDVTITDGVNTVTIAGSGFRSAAYSSGNYLVFSTQQSASTDNLAFSVDSIEITPLVPAAPVGLVATAGNGQAALTWNASAGATSYTVKRDGVAIATVTTTNFTDTGLSNGTTYYYVVSAWNAHGESANSSQVSATPIAPPAAPTGLVVTAGNGQAALTWNASAGATSYTVKRDGVAIAIVTTTNFTDTGLSNGTTYSYTVTASNAGGESTASASVSTTPAYLPSPWQTQDIGAVAATGMANYTNGTFTVNGSGADIAGTADEFRYVYQLASGACEIRARVVSVQNTHSSAKAGVMIRQNLNNNTRNVFVAVTPASGVRYQRRTSAGGNTTTTTAAGLTAPYWVRAVRSGNTVTAYRSANGTSWTSMGSVNVSMGTTVYIGLAVTSRNDGSLCTATFDNVTATP